MNPRPVSVITVCYNAAETIRDAIESVLCQTYPEIEYLIIDGASTDGTLEILAEYRDRVSVVVSEPDQGIADAFNKGISRAKGEFIQLLNADDVMPCDKIEKSLALLDLHPDAAFVFGSLTIMSKDGRPTMRVEGDNDYRRKIRKRMPRLNHPTMLVRASVYRKHGLFDIRWRIAMDYDWLLRIDHAGEHGVYSSDVSVFMRDGGVSSSWRHSLREHRDISIKHGFNPVAAWSIYGLSIGKILVRLLLERFLPAALLMKLRPGKTLL